MPGLNALYMRWFITLLNSNGVVVFIMGSGTLPSDDSVVFEEATIGIALLSLLTYNSKSKNRNPADNVLLKV
jgi:hypothetical protein